MLEMSFFEKCSNIVKETKPAQVSKQAQAA